MSKPSLDLFEEWLESLPPDFRRNVTLMLIGFLPGCNLLMKPFEDVDVRFVTWLRQYKKQGLKSVGLALAIAPIIEHTVMKSLTGKGQHVQQRANMESVISKIKAKEGADADVSHLEAHIQKLEFLEAQHLKIKAQWDELVEMCLTPHSVRGEEEQE